MPVAQVPYRGSVPQTPPPKVSLGFRLLREGEVTPLEKFLRVYRSWESLDPILAFSTLSGGGEFTRAVSVDLAELLSQPDWLVAGIDDTAPRITRASYLVLDRSGVVTFNLVNPFDAQTLVGQGHLAGSFPGGITTVDGVPTAATVRVLYRPAAGQPGDGALVAEVQSAPDGSWRVDGLDPTLKFDVVGRKPWFNDVIMSNVSPKVD